MRDKINLLGVVLHRMALEVNLGTLWKKALPTFTATVLKDAASCFGSHASTETVLLLAGALGRLVCHFHGRRKKMGFEGNPATGSGEAETSWRKPLVNPSWRFF